MNAADFPSHPDQQVWNEAREAAEARFFTAAGATTPPTDEQRAAVAILLDSVADLATCIIALVPPGPQRAIALTELESVQMRANRGIVAPAIPREQQR